MGVSIGSSWIQETHSASSACNYHLVPTTRLVLRISRSTIPSNSVIAFYFTGLDLARVLGAPSALVVVCCLCMR